MFCGKNKLLSDLKKQEGTQQSSKKIMKIKKRIQVLCWLLHVASMVWGILVTLISFHLWKQANMLVVVGHQYY